MCKDHGDFYIAPVGHVVMKYGCIACGGTKKRTTEEFISKASSLHNNKYDYRFTQYINTGTEVRIICPQHGEFLQTPFAHMQSFGCRECARIQNIQTRIASGAELVPFSEKNEYEQYCIRVRSVTLKQYTLHKDKINPNNLKRAKAYVDPTGYHIDHIFSVVHGFLNRVTPEVIGHYTNLRMILSKTNLSKNRNSDKSLSELYEDYNTTTKGTE